MGQGVSEGVGEASWSAGVTGWEGRLQERQGNLRILLTPRPTQATVEMFNSKELGADPAPR